MIKKFLFGIWLSASLTLLIFSGPTIFAATGILISGLSTLLFWIFRKPVSSVVSGLRISPKRKFVLIGSIGAVWVEFEFWVLEKVFGVSLAASPDLFLDLLVTMPWYILMVFLLWKVETKYSYSLFAILIYGGIYDFFADGILGMVLGAWDLSLGNLVLLLMTYPAFVLSYSFIVFPPSYLLREEISKIRTETKGGMTKYLYGLLPLVGLLAYGIIAVLLFSMG